MAFLHFTVIFIDRKAREIIRLVASVRPSVCQHYASGAEWSIYGLGVPSAKQHHHDTLNTVQDLCVFVSNKGKFGIQEPRAAVGGF